MKKPVTSMPRDPMSGSNYFAAHRVRIHHRLRPRRRRLPGLFEQAFGFSRGFVHESGTYGRTGQRVKPPCPLPPTNWGDELPRRRIQAHASAQPLGMEIGLVTDDVHGARAPWRPWRHGLSAPQRKPWGQVVSYVHCPDGTLVELCTRSRLDCSVMANQWAALPGAFVGAGPPRWRHYRSATEGHRLYRPHRGQSPTKADHFYWPPGIRPWRPKKVFPLPGCPDLVHPFLATPHHQPRKTLCLEPCNPIYPTPRTNPATPQAHPVVIDDHWPAQARAR